MPFPHRVPGRALVVRFLAAAGFAFTIAVAGVFARPVAAPLPSRALAPAAPLAAPAAYSSSEVNASAAADASSSCGGENERACNILEVIFEGRRTCNAGLIEKPGCSGDCNGSSGTCRRITSCGGEGQRACTVTEGQFRCGGGLVEIPGCTGNCYGPIFDSIGMCTKLTACGGRGQRACTVAEVLSELKPTCNAGLFEVPGCSGDCVGPTANSSGRCTVMEPIAEPETNATQTFGSCNLSGYADMHTHLFGHMAHGGGVLAGKPSGYKCTKNADLTETCVDQGVNDALKPDFTTDLDLVNGTGTESARWADAQHEVTTNGTFLANQFQGLAQFVANLITLLAPCPSFLGSVCGTQDYFHGPHDPLLGDSVGSVIGTKDGADSNLGAPLFNGWPKWTSTTHQQTYYKWLERAYQGGLRLMTQLAVTNEALCRGGKHIKGVNCTNSMASIDEQIDEAYRFQAFIDAKSGGTGKGWFRIVKTPLEAREAIARGKLAVVLGIETAELFNCYDDPTKACTKAFVEGEIDRYYNKGIRHVFPIHNFDNGFGAAATWQDSIEVGQRLVEGRWWSTEDCSADGYGFKLGGNLPIGSGLTQTIITLLKFSTLIDVATYPQRPESASCNRRGLIQLGRDLLNKMMDKGMIIDVDHMSVKSFNDTLSIAEARQYPVVASHVLSFDRQVKDTDGLFGREGTRHERLRTAAQLQRIKGVGGMIAAMLKDDAQDTGNRGKKLTIGYGDVSDDCRHSSKTFAHAYQYAVDQMGGPVALGSDFNGVAAHVGPRFGTDACGGKDNDGYVSERNAQLGHQISYPFTISGNGATFGTFQRQQTGHRTFDYNYDGMAHVGLLPDFIADLKMVGLPASDMDAMFGSAEAYIKMWERATDKTASPDDDTPAAAKAGTCAYFNIPDGASPVIDVPDDITRFADSRAGVLVSFEVTATDPQDGVLPVTCSSQTGSTFPRGTTSVNCEAHDKDNHSVTGTFRINVLDAPPEIEPSQNLVVEAKGPGGSGVAYGVPMTFDAVDGDRPASCVQPPFTQFPIGHSLVTCSVTDSGGNTVRSYFDVWVRDTIAPVVTVDLSSPPNAAGWHKGPSPVSLAWSWSDAVGVTDTSGGCAVNQVQADGTTSITCEAFDAALNRGEKTVTIKLDRTLPVITFASPSSPPNASGWHRSDVDVPYGIVDTVSGLPAGAPAGGTLHYSVEGTGLTKTITATDVAGNTATATSPPINLDKTPPAVTGARVTPANAYGWNNTMVRSTFSAQDSLSGLDGPARADVDLTREGANQIASRAFSDRAGNSASASVSGINIDLTRPTIDSSLAPPANANGWNNTSVTVSFLCNDALSGVDSCSPAALVTAEGSSQARTGQARDKAGNEATGTTAGINIDKTPPVVRCSNNGPALWPPDHRMVAFGSAVTVDGGISGAGGFTLLAATSNEPDNGLGDGDTANDIQGWLIGTADTAGMFRAERSGKGNGRSYALLYEGRDRADNATRCSTTVMVAHDQGKQ